MPIQRYLQSLFHRCNNLHHTMPQTCAHGHLPIIGQLTNIPALIQLYYPLQAQCCQTPPYHVRLHGQHNYYLQYSITKDSHDNWWFQFGKYQHYTHRAYNLTTGCFSKPDKSNHQLFWIVYGHKPIPNIIPTLFTTILSNAIIHHRFQTDSGSINCFRTSHLFPKMILPCGDL